VNNSEKQKGLIYIIPSPIGDTSPLEVLPISIKKVIDQINHFIVENEKIGRRFIKKITPNKNQDELIISTLNKFTSKEDLGTYLDPCLRGISIGILSDSGCPGIADPGAEIISLAHKFGVKVKPLIGPSSIILAMMSSGMNGQSFSFNGYLPIDDKNRTKAILKYQRISLKENQTQIFIETPYRSDKLFIEMLKVLDASTLLCIACDISLNTEFIKTLPIALWKKKKIIINKRPCIFIIQGAY
jgi:16S rRNA (cytidine1402-2'-O)-methyltransferase